MRATVVRSREARRRPAGFTLIELLVVVAVISVLVAILLPALARARDAAKTAGCLNQIGQIGRAMAMYRPENYDFWPPDVSSAGGGKWWVSGTGGVGYKISFMDLLLPYAANDTKVFAAPCSDFIPTSGLPGGYAYNARLYWCNTNKTDRPSTLPQFVCCKGRYQVYPQFYGTANWAKLYEQLLFPHQQAGRITPEKYAADGAGNIQFADGHVQTVSIYDPIWRTEERYYPMSQN